MEIIGKYGKAIVFTENIEEAAITQIYDLLNTKMVEEEKVRIMEDTHCGNGCVVGYTQTYSGGPLDPDVVGCDISCGMLSVKYKMPSGDPELALWDARIRRDIPMGMEVNEKTVIQEKEFKKFFKTKLERARSLWPEFVCYEGQGKKIKEEIEKLHASGRYTIPPSRFLVTHEDISGYLGDMFFAQAYAEYNRIVISERIKKALGLGKELERIESIHNYIDPRDRIIRKGSIQAYAGQKVIIPMNMAFGTLICEGLGNPDRNYSAPHGAGRLMSRREARERLSLQEFNGSMGNVYSSSVCLACIDEAPEVYKDPSEIITGIQDTVKILEIIKPILSIKAGTGDGED